MNARFYLTFGIKTTLKSHFWRKKVLVCHYVRNVIIDVKPFPKNL